MIILGAFWFLTFIDIKQPISFFNIIVFICWCYNAKITRTSYLTRKNAIFTGIARSKIEIDYRPKRMEYEMRIREQAEQEHNEWKRKRIQKVIDDLNKL